MSAPTPDHLNALATELASIEAEAKLTSANLSQIRSNRQRSAVGVIQEAVSLTALTTSGGSGDMTYSEVRGTLLSHGILKGTVSKILTVVQALNDGVISPSDVKSLNSGYAAVKLALAVHSSPEPSSPEPSSSAAPGHVCPPPAPPTPDEALEVILHTIKTSGDVFKAAGEWIEKVTNAISDVTRASALEDEED